ncbi:MAG TPA: STT3 domain-containing protein, partial [Candidatus Thermoplasmatota archaeon]|nr:STT3 domain-containing protein [Candidatus Thermoplasmatota archaeon]
MPLHPLARRLLRFWEVPFLAALGWWMYRLRMGSYALNVTEDRVYYMGTDPYFHLRALLVSLENFPRALRWDPWTFFPRGTFTGQFGTLFDQTLAAAVLVLTGGEPTRQFAERALAVYPAVLGGLCIVPVYLVARRLFGNPGAVYASILLAILPGSFFTRSVAAYGDHHVAETLTSTLAVFGVLVAVERARAAEATLVAWRAAPRRTLVGLAGWGALGALALTVYFWTWPPAMLFVAILAGALLLLVGLDHARGRTSRGTAFAAAVVFGGALLLVLPLRETSGFEVTWYSWTQPLSLFVPALAIPAAALGSERLA